MTCQGLALSGLVLRLLPFFDVRRQLALRVSLQAVASPFALVCSHTKSRGLIGGDRIADQSRMREPQAGLMAVGAAEPQCRLVHRRRVGLLGIESGLHAKSHRVAVGIEHLAGSLHSSYGISALFKTHGPLHPVIGHLQC